MEECFSKSKCLLYLPLGGCKSSFNLEKAVCNHGFFMMAPNKWISSTKSLQRPLRLADQYTSVFVTISHHSESDNIQIYVHDIEGLSLENEQAILEQVARMLRISDKDEKTINEFQAIYPQAKEEEFGRIFRSPSLFEDVVKSILLCNSGWGKTLKMVKSLCEVQLQGSSSEKNQGIGNFPNSNELVKLGEANLREHCKIGYRAQHIINLAQKVEKGTLKLEKLENEWHLWPYKTVYSRLIKLEGCGPFVVATILMCMGYYEKVPFDSETKRHLKQAHGISSCINEDVEEIYKAYAPFQCIAFWFELLRSYEIDHGKLSELRESHYPKITSRPRSQKKEMLRLNHDIFHLSKRKRKRKYS